MKVLVSGSTGLIGQAICSALSQRGHVVRRLVRHDAGGSRFPVGTTVAWSANGELPLQSLEGFDVVIHLAGEPIHGMWTTEKRRRILESRVGPTKRLAEALTRLVHPPRLLLTASGVNFYGTHPQNVVDESSPTGGGFLAEVTRRWEAAAQVATSRGIAVGHLRFGIVLSPYGGALKQMLPLFRLGLGGKLDGGDQVWSWVSITDAANAAVAVAENPDASGPYNVVAPGAVTNAQFTQALAHRLHRPAFLPVPATLLTLVLPGFAEETMLASICAMPAKLQAMGFRFSHPTVDDALKALV